jgi:UDP-N-acetylglucosamine--N-acetylmuramyl-(pentapeptide) pyrophosphoryl-undecaprenol N-acetylglucosamine transferase
MGKGVLDVLRGLLSVPIGIWQSLRILKQRRANLVIGVGGYTSPTMLVAAALKGIARVILEPNAYPGLANKAVAPFAQRVFLAFESAGVSFDQRKVRVVGTPVRQEFFVSSRQNGDSSEHRGQHLLIFGGSQGAKAVNSTLLEGLALLHERLPGLTITHQTGEEDFERVSAAYHERGLQAKVVPFLYDMPAVLRTADLVVARSGAMTIAELTACGKAAVLIPLPTAIYDHQMKNARAMEAAGGAIVLPQADLNGAKLAETIVAVLSNLDRLSAMQKKSLEMRRSDAAEAIVRECYALMDGTHEINPSRKADGG